MPFSVKLFGIFGWPVGYSLSPNIQNQAFQAAGLDWTYVLLPTQPEDLKDAIARFRAEGFGGANVTIPHKETVMAYLDGLRPTAEAIGAVNTLFWQAGRLMGDNTDAPGFLRDLEKKGIQIAGRSVLILGAGGSAKAIGYAVHQAGAAHVRTWKRQDESLAMPADLTVNCTPGLSPEYLEEIQFKPGQVLYDLVYVPEETPLMTKAKAQGALSFNGYGMLLEQAALSFEIWKASGV